MPAQFTFIVLAFAVPGDNVGLPLTDGSAITIGPLGELMHDTQPVGSARALMQFGPLVYCRGLTKPLLWEWVVGIGWKQAPAGFRFTDDVWYGAMALPPTV